MFDCHLLASHTPGIHNELADHLSRNHASVFLQRAPSATSPSPHQVSRDLQNLVLGPWPARLDVRSLEASVQGYFREGLASSSRRTYAAGINKYLAFCTLYNLYRPLEVTQSTLCYYVSHLANTGLAFSTIKTYLAAVRFTNDRPPPPVMDMPKLQMVLSGVQRVLSLSRNPCIRLPITPPLLRQLRTFWSQQACSYEHIMLWAVCCVCFIGFFRLGEPLYSPRWRPECSSQVRCLDGGMARPLPSHG
jgi:hypothetical protein